MADGDGGIGDWLSRLGRGVAGVAAVPLTGLAMLEAARRGQNPLGVLTEQQTREQQLRAMQQQGLLARAQAFQDPAARAFLTQNPEAAAQLGLPSVPTGIASPEVLAAGGFGPGGPPPGTSRLGVVPPSVETTQSLQRRMAAMGVRGQEMLQNMFLGGGEPGAGEHATAEGVPSPTPSLTDIASGSAPTSKGARVLSVGGVPMTPVPEITSSGHVGLGFRVLTPLKLNAPTAQKMGLQSGDTYQGRPVIVEEALLPAQVRYKKETAKVLNKWVDKLETSLNKIGDYGPQDALWRSGKTWLGMADPEWKAVLDSADLVGSALMNVHVGARGSEGMMQHFISGLVGAAHQSSANLHASIGVIKQYLKLMSEGTDADTALKEAQASVPTTETPQGPQGTTTTTTLPPTQAGGGPDYDAITQDLLQRHRVRTLGRAQ